MKSPRVLRSLTGSPWFWLIGASVALASGCSNDDGGGASPGASGSGGSSAGKGGNASAGKGGGSGKGGTSSEAGAEAQGGTANGGAGGDGTTGPAVTFEIPAGGGEVEVPLPSGNTVAFDFPASAAGTTVTLTPASATSVGWPEGHFDDVITMEPDGLQFDDPVEIRPSTGGVLLFDYASTGAKGPAEGLALNAAGDALELNHFSTLVVVPPDVSCDSQSAWMETANDAACTDFGTASSRLEYVCKAYSYCLLITASCCAEPGTTQCELGLPALTLTYQPYDSNGGQYPYCDPGSGAGGAGGAGSGSGGTPGAGGDPGAAGTPGAAGAGGAGSGAEPIASNVVELMDMRLDATNVYFNASGTLNYVPLAGGTPTPFGSPDMNGKFDIDATYAYYSGSGGYLVRVPKDGSSNESDLLVTGAVWSDSEVEEFGGTLYVAEGLNVYTVPVAGNTAAAALVSNEPSPHGLTVSNGDLYFATYAGTGTHQKSICKVPIGGGVVTPLLQDLTDNPTDIAVAGTYVYYITGTAIARVAAAGGSSEPVASAGGSYLEVSGQDIYFVDGTSLSHSDLAGTMTPLASSLINPRVAVDATHVYYSTMGASGELLRLAR